MDTRIFGVFRDIIGMHTHIWGYMGIYRIFIGVFNHPFQVDVDMTVTMGNGP